MKPPVEMKKDEAKPALPPIAIRGQKNGQPFDIRVATRDDAERLAADFREQGAQDITITEAD